MWRACAFFALALAELGFTVVSSSPDLDGQAVRVKNGRLVVGGGDAPLLQAHFSRDTLVLSERIVAASALGAGIGIGKDGHLSIAARPAGNFGADGGHLEHDDSPLFSVAQNSNGDMVLYDYWAAAGEQRLPVVIQLAGLVYAEPERPTLYTTVYETVEATRTQTVDPVTSTILVYQDIVYVTTTTAVALPPNSTPTG